MPSKRRREEAVDGPPTKKAAITTLPANLRLSFLAETKPCPVIASSPGFSIPSKITFKSYRNSTSDQIILQSSSHPRLDYEAHEEQDENVHLDDYLGMFDAETGTLKLVKAKRVVMRNTLRPKEAAESEAENVQETYYQRRQRLGMAFGTRKTQKAIQEQSSNAISPSKSKNGKPAAVDEASKAVLDSIQASTADMPNKEKLQATIDEGKPRPKPNMAAATLFDIYPLSSLISAEELQHLPVKDWAEAAAAKRNVVVPSRFVARRMKSIAEQGVTDTLRALRYLYFLTELFLAGRRTRTGGQRIPPLGHLKKRIPDAPNQLLECMLARYVDAGEMNKWRVDYLMTHICALSLIVDNFNTDVNDLREDLRLDNRQITLYYRELGAAVNEATLKDLEDSKIPPEDKQQHRHARLRLPLQFPKQRTLPMRR